MVYTAHFIAAYIYPKLFHSIGSYKHSRIAHVPITTRSDHLAGRERSERSR